MLSQKSKELAFMRFTVLGLPDIDLSPFSIGLCNVPEQQCSWKTTIGQGQAGLLLVVSLALMHSEKLSSLKGLKKWAPPAVVCGGLASAEEGFTVSASLEVTQHIHHHSGVWHLSSNLSSGSTSSVTLVKLCNLSKPQCPQLQNADNAAFLWQLPSTGDEIMLLKCFP